MFSWSNYKACTYQQSQFWVIINTIKVYTGNRVILEKSHSQMPSDSFPFSLHCTSEKRICVSCFSSGPKPLLKVVDHTTRLMDSFKICDYIFQIRSQQCSVVLLCLSLGLVWNSRHFLPVFLLPFNLTLLLPFKYILLVDNLASLKKNK